LAVFDSKGGFDAGHVGFLETSTTRRIYFRGELYRWFHEFGERTMGRFDFLVDVEVRIPGRILCLDITSGFIDATFK
jgi:hypothetical protein